MLVVAEVRVLMVAGAEPEEVGEYESEELAEKEGRADSEEVLDPAPEEREEEEDDLPTATIGTTGGDGAKAEMLEGMRAERPEAGEMVAKKERMGMREKTG